MNKYYTLIGGDGTSLANYKVVGKTTTDELNEALEFHLDDGSVKLLTHGFCYLEVSGQKIVVNVNHANIYNADKGSGNAIIYKLVREFEVKQKLKEFIG